MPFGEPNSLSTEIIAQPTLTVSFERAGSIFVASTAEKYALPVTRSLETPLISPDCGVQKEYKYGGMTPMTQDVEEIAMQSAPGGKNERPKVSSRSRARCSSPIIKAFVYMKDEFLQSDKALARYQVD